MKDFLFRLGLSAALMLIGFALASSTQSGSNPDALATQQPGERHDLPSYPGGENLTQDAHSFTGRVFKENGQFVLKDPVTKMHYGFDDESKARQYVGKQVRVTGKLDLNSNVIHVDNIEPLP